MLLDERRLEDLVVAAWPPRTADRGRGLWLVNQLCDLVELRSDEEETVVRLHMTLA
jgi:hypothetical protein